jgi:hypothetical protein
VNLFKRLLLISAWIATGLALVWVGWWVLAIAPFLIFPCEHTTKAYVLSPDQQRVAAIVEGNCGATAPFTTSIYLRPATEHSNSESDLVLVMRNRLAVRVEWQDASTLLVRHPIGEEYRKETTHDGVRISYVVSE